MKPEVARYSDSNPNNGTCLHVDCCGAKSPPLSVNFPLTAGEHHLSCSQIPSREEKSSFESVLNGISTRFFNYDSSSKLVMNGS